MFLRRAAFNTVRILRNNAGGGGEAAGAAVGAYHQEAAPHTPRLKSNLNKVMLIGTVGQNPRFFTFANNARKVTFSVATNETYKTRDGQFKTVVEWHNIAVYQEKLGTFILDNVSKGAQVFIEGSISSSKINKDGVQRQVTEIRINPFSGSVKILHKGPQQQGEEITYVNDEEQPPQEETDYVS